MIVLIRTRFAVDTARWTDAYGGDEATAARDLSYYLSDANSCLPSTGEEGGPANVSPRDWRVERTADLFEDTVRIRCTWAADCPAEDWTTWRADPRYGTAVHVPDGRAREDMARVIAEELFTMGLLSETRATMTVLHPYQQHYEHQWRLASARRPGPDWSRCSPP
ncbi:hypothetical protein [Kitasatospora sp. MBT63]|uniref:hypothetical protein n=1 Tax=Kitasatospora sp. MBT63 TaxID=1444768 RepID=UPI0005398142|nr:hypothetical protein [Kitasatospora sp. MBT63]